MSSAARAEIQKSDVSELVRDSELLASPLIGSKRLGKLPRGTILTFLGEVKNGYSLVRVELVDRELEAWVKTTSLRNTSPEVAEKMTETEGKTKKRVSPVPKDELLLLSRDPSFLYGAYFGPNYNVITTDFNVENYTGIGFGGGALVGFFLQKNFLLKGIFGYTVTNGTGTDGDANFGLIDFGAQAEYVIDSFVVFGGLQYSVGSNIGNIARSIIITTASDVTSLWGVGGAGMRFSMGGLNFFILRLNYGASFVRSPVGFQSFGLTASFEIEG